MSTPDMLTAISSPASDIAAALEYAENHEREAQVIDTDVRHVVIDNTGVPRLIEPTDRFDIQPAYPVRTIEARTADGLVAAVKVGADEATRTVSEEAQPEPGEQGSPVTLYADAGERKLTAVLDDDRYSAPGWRRNRVVYAPQHTLPWKHWTGNAGLHDQEVFARIVEEGLPELVTPTAAQMYELAQTFEASVSGKFKQATKLANGARQLAWEEDVDAKAGEGGLITIPEKFTLHLAPYVGSDSYDLEAWFRYTVTAGKLKIGYKLIRPEDVLDVAFADVVAKVGAQLPKVPVVEAMAPAAARADAALGG